MTAGQSQRSSRSHFAHHLRAQLRGGELGISFVIGAAYGHAKWWGAKARSVGQDRDSALET